MNALESFRKWMIRAALVLAIQIAVTGHSFAQDASGGGCPIGQATLSFSRTAPQFDDSVSLSLEPFGATRYLQTINSTAIHMCGLAVRCDPTARYRTYSGACSGPNFMARPTVGARHQCHRRLLPASFIDGISTPQAAVDVAVVYNALQQQSRKESARDFAVEGSLNGMFATTGQFLAHDFTHTFLAAVSRDSRTNFDCCATVNHRLPQCSMRIDVSQAIGYKEGGVTCMSFVRAARCPCSAGRTRETMNLQTAYLDLSHVYGSGIRRNASSRWRLPSTEPTASGPLPSIDPKPAMCYGPPCFGGDGRINQQQGISLHHVVFERLHNQMADQLRRLAPSWADDQVFEEARRLVIARWQYVVCREIVGILADDNILRQRNLHIDQLMRGTSVDLNAEAVTFVESVHSQFRGHGWVPNGLGGEDLHWLNSSLYFTVRDYARKNAIAQWSSPGKPMFPFADAVAQDLFKRPDDCLGLSILLINIQRERDTGVPTFKAMTEWAHRIHIRSFEDVAKLNVFRQADLNLLRTVYKDDVSLVDMFVAGHLQIPYGNGVLPFSHQMIHLHQHYGQVYGDRFFFSHRNVFTAAQRHAIAESSSFSQILCETLGLTEVPWQPFLYHAQPRMLKCSSVTPFNYKLFVNSRL